MLLLISERLTNRRIFDAEGLWHEYVLLAREQFPNLSLSNQQTILSWINAGPDLKAFEDWKRQVEGKLPTGEQIDRHKKHWQLECLAPLREVLPPEWRHRYSELVSELGEPEHPEFVSYSTSWVGPTSSKSAADLGEMSVQTLIEFLQTWQPSNEDWSPSPEGLGRALSPLVSANPERFAVEAEKFCQLTPTYIRSFINGFQKAVTERRSFSWSPVLRLCQWVVSQQSDSPEDQREGIDIDIGWNSTRIGVASLLSDGVRIDDKRVEISSELRSLVWNVLKPLTNDPDPTPEREARYHRPTMDPATLSINTTRGEAMHAVIRYALWVRGHVEKELNGKERLKRGFDEMPEVREVLEAHLDPARDPSLAIRSVYGQWFPWLVLLDQQWAAAHVTTIFPTDEAQANLRNAAWETYITFCDAYDSAFSLLREEYRHAIEGLGTQHTRRVGRDEPDQRLTEHLMILYWRRQIPLNERTSLLPLFYEKASPTLHSHAIEFIGRNLSQGNDPIPPELLERLEVLWNWRLAAIQKAGSPVSHSAELVAFSSWYIDTWKNHARTILSMGLQSPNTQTRELAEDLVNRIMALGHFEFRNLLQK